MHRVVPMGTRNVGTYFLSHGVWISSVNALHTNPPLACWQECWRAFWISLMFDTGFSDRRDRNVTLYDTVGYVSWCVHNVPQHSVLETQNYLDVRIRSCIPELNAVRLNSLVQYGLHYPLLASVYDRRTDAELFTSGNDVVTLCETSVARCNPRYLW